MVSESYSERRAVRSQARVLAAATDLLIESGPSAVTVNAVVDASGVAKTTLYRHWPSVTDLLADVLRSNLPDLAPVELDAGFEHALRGYVADVAVKIADPGVVRALPALLDLKSRFPEVDRILQEDRDARLAELGAILRLGVEEGWLPPSISTVHALLIILGPVQMAVLGGVGEEAAAVGELSVERFLDAYRYRRT